MSLKEKIVGILKQDYNFEQGHGFTDKYHNYVVEEILKVLEEEKGK